MAVRVVTQTRAAAHLAVVGQEGEHLHGRNSAESRGAWCPGKRRADNMRRPGAIPRASASDSAHAALLAAERADEALLAASQQGFTCSFSRMLLRPPRVRIQLQKLPKLRNFETVRGRGDAPPQACRDFERDSTGVAAAGW